MMLGVKRTHRQTIMDSAFDVFLPTIMELQSAMLAAR